MLNILYFKNTKQTDLLRSEIMEQFLYTLLEPALAHHTLKGYVLNS